ncbi:TPA: GTP diphosphokinase [Vibrio vulnificus]|uniref:GTP pyrophosphokinase n=1 Tax=Vibrio vulnificus (strain CMCP6) TaxID=216895 RepID=A0A3Q0L3Y2_VIBVU|nr:MULTISPECIES: GTP diphosphokinase [Vibrio]OJI59598.1 GTP pyrophosphokinase [Vibrio fluvialis]AAO09999.2 GTP pyrophosphokinase [Vibrio vulnificus CMCP6]ADV85507.1 GTP pyrophosphokinase, (p)ppGpp synthetase I [Vibrio vulnificus MO6-24/O]AIL71608.1 GTP pyrophosphokinase [Vibrio vulnificus]ARN66946.1 GTP pyrophosphokinase, (p)ppGpp synthetase I [Vibrio vulnificus]
MVAVRSAHLNQNEQFELESWVASLKQDAGVSKRLIEVYRHCQTILQGHEHAELLLWRGREMIEILVTLSMDKATLVAAQLFPLVSSGAFAREPLEEHYSKEIIKLIDGVDEMAAIGQLNITLEGSAASAQVDNVRRMLLAMVDDFRCVVIKLAERICNLIEVKKAPDEVRRAAAKECANIYAPLANRLGIGQLKWEIEDYAFRYQQPDTYKQIAKQLSERRIVREQYIKDFVDDLSEEMKECGINAEVSGRPKHIYSIWRKMQKKSLAFDELFDVRAVRIIADKLQDCYAALGVVHTKYKHLPSEFDDYVANPKPNGYQSIHTVVLGPEGKTIEIQIRTKQMHEDSELGVAAHWKYKEGSSSGRSGYDEKITWLRKLLDWQEEMSDSGEMLDELRSQVFDDRVYAFTPRGDVVDLPMGATPLDFAYHIHSEVGHRCIGAKVAGRIVPFTHKLNMGDQVEIITQKEPNPSRDWLNPSLGFVTSGRARAKINAWFRKQSREKNLEAGREILENELAKIGATLKDAEQYAVKRFNVKSADELYVGVGSGDLRINQILNHINALVNKPTAEEEDRQALERLQEAGNKAAGSPTRPRKDAVVVQGVDNLMSHLARCCQPIPGDEICGYITQGRGISVHRADCEQLEELRHHAPERIIDTVWGSDVVGSYMLTVRVEAMERSGLLKDITTMLANEKIKVISMKSRLDYRTHLNVMDFELEVTNIEVLTRIMKRVEQIKDVMLVKRLG